MKDKKMDEKEQLQREIKDYKGRKFFMLHGKWGSCIFSFIPGEEMKTAEASTWLPEEAGQNWWLPEEATSLADYYLRNDMEWLWRSMGSMYNKYLNEDFKSGLLEDIVDES